MKLPEGNLLPFAADIIGERCTIMQDGASIHRSKLTKEWIVRKEVDFLQWPAHIPDVNVIENVWRSMVRDVHPSQRFNLVHLRLL